MKGAALTAGHIKGNRRPAGGVDERPGRSGEEFGNNKETVPKVPMVPKAEHGAKLVARDLVLHSDKQAAGDLKNP